jgi:hypothetical protein
LRVRIGAEASGAWQELSRAASEQGGPLALEEMSAERSSEFEALIKYETEQWERYLFPYYKQMLQILQEKIWLAEDCTREQFQKLIVYVELWERCFNETLPGEVIERLGVSEDELKPLYEDLEQTFRSLRAKLT